MNSSEEKRVFAIGEVYLMRFSGSGSEQDGWRPGLVFQNNVGNAFSPNVIALPFTSSIKKTKQPTHVVLKANECGLQVDSMVLCENPQRISKLNIGRYVTTLSDRDMERVAVANLLATSAISYIKPEMLNNIWERANYLNRVV